MFDSHCHLQALPDADAALARAEQAGVRQILLAGVDPDSWARDDALTTAHPSLAVAYGLHPAWVIAHSDEACDQALWALEQRLRRREPRVVAVGEIGLHGREASERQERLFLRQLALAREYRLPVVLHILRQHPRALALLSEQPLPLGGVLHSCSASAELVPSYLRLGLHLSFSGALTWHGGQNRTVRAARAVPRDRFLVETDSPDQTPEPHRPGRNEPAFLVAIVRAVAQIWDVDFELAAQVTEANARRLFAL